MILDDKPMFLVWLAEVNRLCRGDYAISAKDMSFLPEDLIKHFEDGDTPAEYRDYVGRKYDLTRHNDLMLRG